MSGAQQIQGVIPISMRYIFQFLKGQGNPFSNLDPWNVTKKSARDLNSGAGFVRNNPALQPVDVRNCPERVEQHNCRIETKLATLTYQPTETGCKPPYWRNRNPENPWNLSHCAVPLVCVAGYWLWQWLHSMIGPSHPDIMKSLGLTWMVVLAVKHPYIGPPQTNQAAWLDFLGSGTGRHIFSTPTTIDACMVFHAHFSKCLRTARMHTSD